MMIAWAEVEPKLRTPVVIWRPIIDRRSIIRIAITRWSVGRVNLGLLIHVEIDLLRNVVLRTKPLTRPEKTDLLKLVGGQRQGPDHIVSGAKVVKRPVRVAENLQMHRCVAHHLAIGFDSRARRGSLYRHIVSHRAMRSALGAGGYGLTPGKQDRCDQCCDVDRCSIHLEIDSLRIGNFTTRNLNRVYSVNQRSPDNREGLKARSHSRRSSGICVAW